MRILKLPTLGDWPPIASHGLAAVLGLLAGFLLIPKASDRLSLSPHTVAVSLDASQVTASNPSRQFPAERMLIRVPSSDTQPCNAFGTSLKIHRLTPSIVVSFPASDLRKFTEIMEFHKSHPLEKLYLTEKAEGETKQRCANGERIVYGT